AGIFAGDPLRIRIGHICPMPSVHKVGVCIHTISKWLDQEVLLLHIVVGGALPSHVYAEVFPCQVNTHPIEYLRSWPSSDYLPISVIDYAVAVIVVIFDVAGPQS